MPSAVTAKENEEAKKAKIDLLKRSIPEVERLFDIHNEVGEGTFSTVFLASLKGDEAVKKKYAIKHIVPTCHPDRIKSELKCLKFLGGQNNVAGVELCLRHNNSIVFVMPYMHHESFTEYYNKMDVCEVAFYMKNLLIALAHIHKFEIIHRDVKPSNFLYDRKNKRFLLVDFGLAQNISKSTSVVKRKCEDASPDNINTNATQKRAAVNKEDSSTKTNKNNKSDQENIPQNMCYDTNIFNLTSDELEKKKKQLQEIHKREALRLIKNSIAKIAKETRKPCNCYGKPLMCRFCMAKPSLIASRAGTPGFRPPEVLLKVKNQTTAVDIWAAGVIFLSILSHTCNFFNNVDDATALAELMTVFGFERLHKLAQQFNRYLITSEKMDDFELEKLCRIMRARGSEEEFTDVFPKSAYDLLGKLLDVNPNTRITAEKALEHDFFKLE